LPRALFRLGAAFRRLVTFRLGALRRAGFLFAAFRFAAFLAGFRFAAFLCFGVAFFCFATGAGAGFGAAGAAGSGGGV
jgi:hypothetical protein